MQISPHLNYFQLVFILCLLGAQHCWVLWEMQCRGTRFCPVIAGCGSHLLTAGRGSRQRGLCNPTHVATRECVLSLQNTLILSKTSRRLPSGKWRGCTLANKWIFPLPGIFYCLNWVISPGSPIGCHSGKVHRL